MSSELIEVRVNPLVFRCIILVLASLMAYDSLFEEPFAKRPEVIITRNDDGTLRRSVPEDTPLDCIPWSNDPSQKAPAVALTDPQSVTINAVAHSLPRVRTTDTGASYSNADGTVRLTASHTYGRRNRRTARVDFQKTAPDPLFPAQNTPFTMAAYVVVDVPKVGFTVVEQKQIVDALTAWLSATSGANTTKILGGES